MEETTWGSVKVGGQMDGWMEWMNEGGGWRDRWMGGVDGWMFADRRMGGVNG